MAEEKTGNEVVVRCTACGFWLMRAKQGSTVEVNCGKCKATMVIRVNGQVSVEIVKPGKAQA